MNDDWSLLESGGDMKIESQKVNAKAKVGSMDNVGQEPGGGNGKVVNSILHIKNVSLSLLILHFPEGLSEASM